MIDRTCRHCGASLEGEHGKRLFCNDAHKARATRRRAAGLPEDAYSGDRGASRGRVPLGRRTRQEIRLELLTFRRAA